MDSDVFFSLEVREVEVGKDYLCEVFDELTRKY